MLAIDFLAPLAALMFAAIPTGYEVLVNKNYNLINMYRFAIAYGVYEILPARFLEISVGNVCGFLLYNITNVRAISHNSKRTLTDVLCADRDW
jgi:hypothetical protein